MTRIVSLLSSATEIVCALGCEDQLVGRSHECDFPESIKQLPLCTEVKFNTFGTSYEIDQRVRAIVQEGLSVYRVKGDLLRDLSPDIIITQTQCEVCAVSLKDVEEATCELIGDGKRPRVISLTPNALANIWSDIRRVAEALDAKEKGEALILSLQRRMRAIAQKTKNLKRPTIASMEWIDLLMTGGNWMPELIEMAGGKNLFGEAGKHSPMLRWDGFSASDPDAIIVHPCGWDIPKSREEMKTLIRKSEWKNLKAVRNGRVFLCDGNQYFNRPGPRIVESLEILAEIFHPEIFSFGHQGRGWEKMTRRGILIS